MADTLNDVAQSLGRLRGNMDSFAQAFLSAASARIAARATGTYMSKGRKGLRARIDVGPLRIVSGRLARSLTGARFTAGRSAFLSGNFAVGIGSRFRQPPLRARQTNITGASEGINRIERRAPGRWRLTKGSTVPGAAIHEFGGSIKITARMRRFFWAKYYEASGFERLFWQRMALTKKQFINIPKRAYLHPALDDELPRLRDMANEGLSIVVRETLQS